MGGRQQNYLSHHFYAWQRCSTAGCLAKGHLEEKSRRVELQMGLGPHTCEQAGEGSLKERWHRGLTTSEVSHREDTIPGERQKKILN